MKQIGVFLTGILLFAGISSCNNAQTNTQTTKSEKAAILENPDSLMMSEDSLYAEIISDVTKEINLQKDKLTENALTTISETQNILQLINKGEKDKAIEAGHKLIGKLEVLLTKNPSLEVIPVDVSFEKNELFSDIETVRESVKEAKEAMDKGYYQYAESILQNLKSEIDIYFYAIPAGSYPDAVKLATALLEDGKETEAKIVLTDVLSTIVTTKAVLPLPVLKAEKMLEEASSLDAKDHKNADKVISLIKSADYQLQLAEEMGYGKKDKEFASLHKSMKQLLKSVNKKEDSSVKFDSLKSDLKKFKDRLFPVNNEKK